MTRRAEARYVLTAEDRTGQGTLTAENNFERLQASLSGFRVAAVAAGVAAVAAIAKVGGAAIDAARELDDMAKRGRDFGISAETVAALDLAAGRAGVSSEFMAQSLQKVQRELARARDGSEEAQEAFDRLGIELPNIIGQTPVEAFAMVLGRFAAGRRQGATTADIQERFFGRGPQAGRLIDFGIRGLLEAFERRQEIAANINDEAAAAEKAVDQLGEFGTALSNVAQNVLEPVFVSVGEAAEGAADRLGRFSRFWDDLQEAIRERDAGRATRGTDPGTFAD